MIWHRINIPTAFADWNFMNVCVDGHLQGTTSDSVLSSAHYCYYGDHIQSQVLSQSQCMQSKRLTSCTITVTINNSWMTDIWGKLIFLWLMPTCCFYLVNVPWEWISAKNVSFLPKDFIAFPLILRYPKTIERTLGELFSSSWGLFFCSFPFYPDPAVQLILHLHFACALFFPFSSHMVFEMPP